MPKSPMFGKPLSAKALKLARHAKPEMHVQSHVSYDQYVRMKEKCDEAGITVSAYVRMALHKFEGYEIGLVAPEDK